MQAETNFDTTGNEGSDHSRKSNGKIGEESMVGFFSAHDDDDAAAAETHTEEAIVVCVDNEDAKIPASPIGQEISTTNIDSSKKNVEEREAEDYNIQQVQHSPEEDGKLQATITSGRSDGEDAAASATTTTTTTTTTTRPSTPPRNTRAERLARKQQQMNECLPNGGRRNVSLASTRTTRLASPPPNIATAESPIFQNNNGRACLPGDDLVPSSTTTTATAPSTGARIPGDDLVSSPEFLTSRARPSPASTTKSTTTTITATDLVPSQQVDQVRRRAPVPRGPRPVGKVGVAAAAESATTNGNDHSQSATNASSGSIAGHSLNNTPGAFSEQTRAIGDIPSWARDGGAGAGTTMLAGNSVGEPSASTSSGTSTTTGSQPQCTDTSHQDQDQETRSPPNTATRSTSDATTAITDIETSTGLAAAEPVSAETVVYAEDIKEDEIVQARKKFAGFAIMALVVIVGLVVGLIVVLMRSDSDDLCNLPLEDQTISMYCACHGTSDEYMDHFSRTDPDLMKRYKSIRESNLTRTWFNLSIDLPDGSCDQKNLVLQSMAFHINRVPFEMFTKIRPILGERYSLQMFAIHSLYFSLGGDQWTKRKGWLSDPNVCNWEGLDCDIATRVTAIRLQENGLEGSLPTDLFLAPALKELQLSGNAIHGVIPSEFGQLSRLDEMDLSDLRLSGTIPSELGSLDGLHKLDLRNNSLTGSLPAEFQNLRLFLLKVDHNNLTGRLPAFEEGHKDTRLQFLSVKFNQLTGPVPTSLLNASTLEFVDLSRNNFTGEPPDFISASPGIGVVNLIESGFKGELPDRYCITESQNQVMVLAECPDIFGCNTSNVLKCQSVWSQLGKTLYGTGHG